MAGNQKAYQEAMRLGTNFSWDKDWVKALKAYRAALKEYPGNIEALLGLANVYFELEQYESVIRALQRILKTDNAHEEALKRMGQTLEAMGRAEEAAKTYVYGGNMLAKKGKLPQAIQFWQDAIALDTNQLQARNNLAQAFAKQGQTDKAVDELVALAILFQEHNHIDRAATYLQGAKRLDPNLTELDEYLAALQEGQSLAELRDLMQQMVVQPTEPSDQEAQDAETLILSGDDDPFASFFEEATDTEQEGSPKDYTEQLALEELANVIFESDDRLSDITMNKMTLNLVISQAIEAHTRKRLDEAVETFHKIEAAGFRRPALYFMLALLYQQQHLIDEAIKNLTLAKEDHNYEAGCDYVLGECYEQRNDLPQALTYFINLLKSLDLQAVEADEIQSTSRAYDELLRLYLQPERQAEIPALLTAFKRFFALGNYQKRVRMARQLLGSGNGTGVNALIELIETPNTDGILSILQNSRDYMQRNMVMTAIEACYIAVQQAPFYLPLHLRLAEIFIQNNQIEAGINKLLTTADVYQIRGQMDRVAGIYDKILKIAPMDITVRAKLLELYVRQNNVDAALQQYQTMADAYYQLAQVEKAIDKYREAYRLAARAADPVAWQTKILHNLGDIYTQRVNWGKAVDVYRQILKLNPQDEVGITALVDLYFKLGKRNDALVAIERAEQIFEAHNDPHKMRNFLEDLNQLRPQETSLRERLADYYVKLGMIGPAVAQYDVLGEMQIEAGLRDDATYTIEKIIALNPDNVDDYRQLLVKMEQEI